MFYVLNFTNHQFYSCNTAEKVNEKIKDLISAGVKEYEIEVVNAYADEIRMSANEWYSFCKDWAL